VFLPSLIDVRFYHGVDIISGHLPVNFQSDQRSFFPNLTYQTSRKS